MTLTPEDRQKQIEGQIALLIAERDLGLIDDLVEPDEPLDASGRRARIEIRSLTSSRSFQLRQTLIRRCPVDTGDAQMSVRAARGVKESQKRAWAVADVFFDANVAIRATMSVGYAPYIIGKGPHIFGDWWEREVNAWAAALAPFVGMIWREHTGNPSRGVRTAFYYDYSWSGGTEGLGPSRTRAARRRKAA